jgi:hypothetical protein
MSAIPSQELAEEVVLLWPAEGLALGQALAVDDAALALLFTTICGIFEVRAEAFGQVRADAFGTAGAG